MYPGSTSSPAPSTVKPPPVAPAAPQAPGPQAPGPQSPAPQVGLLSKVEMNPGELLGALSKTHAQGGVMQGEGGGGGRDPVMIKDRYSSVIKAHDCRLKGCRFDFSPFWMKASAK